MFIYVVSKRLRATAAEAICIVLFCCRQAHSTDLSAAVAWCRYQSRAADASWPAEFDKPRSFGFTITLTLWVVVAVSLAALVFCVEALNQTCLIFAAFFCLRYKKAFVNPELELYVMSTRLR